MKIFSSLKSHAESFLGRYRGENPATYAAAEQAIGGLLIADGIFGIDNPFGGNNRPGIFGTLGGIVVGVIFMFVPTFMGNISGTNKMTATTTATVVSVGAASSTTSSSSSSSSGTCPMTARYTVDGKEYTQQSSMSSSSNCSLAQGQTININYNPANPSAWSSDVNTVNTFLRVFFWAGLLTVISSLITFVIRLFSIIFGWKLLKDGRKNAASLPQGTNLQTIIEEVKKNFMASVFNFGGAGNASSSDSTKLTP